MLLQSLLYQQHSLHTNEYGFSTALPPPVASCCCCACTRFSRLSVLSLTDPPLVCMSDTTPRPTAPRSVRWDGEMTKSARLTLDEPPDSSGMGWERKCSSMSKIVWNHKCCTRHCPSGFKVKRRCWNTGEWSMLAYVVTWIQTIQLVLLWHNIHLNQIEPSHMHAIYNMQQSE